VSSLYRRRAVLASRNANSDPETHSASENHRNARARAARYNASVDSDSMQLRVASQPPASCYLFHSTSLPFSPSPPPRFRKRTGRMPIIKMARVIRESEQLYKKKGMDVKNYEKRRTANTVACLGPRIGWMLARAHILRFTSIVSRFVRLLSKYLPESSRQQDKECQETFESLASYLRQKCTLLLSEGEERWEGGAKNAPMTASSVRMLS